MLGIFTPAGQAGIPKKELLPTAFKGKIHEFKE
jgi:hypothetical protein